MFMLPLPFNSITLLAYFKEELPKNRSHVCSHEHMNNNIAKLHHIRWLPGPFWLGGGANSGNKRKHLLIALVCALC